MSKAGTSIHILQILGDVFTWPCRYMFVYQDSKVHGANMGPTGPRWAPCWPQEQAILVFIVQILIQVIIVIISKRERLNLVGQIFVLRPCFFYKFVYNIYKFLMLETPCNKSATRSTMIYWCFSLVCWAHPLLDQPKALTWWQNNLTSLTFNIESVVFALIQLHVNNWRD